MAERPAFFIRQGSVVTGSYTFEWFPGFAASQKQKSIESLHYAIMEEGDYPLERMGAASFIITPLGYAAESIMPLYNGWCISSHEGVTGYRYIFVGFLVLLAIGFCACLAFRHFTKERRQELAKLRAAK